MLLAIDGSTVATGFALGGANNTAPKGGVWKSPGADEIHMPRTLGSIADTVQTMVQGFKIEWVCIELPLDAIDRFHSKAACLALTQLLGALRGAIWRAGAKESLAPISEVRKAFGCTPYLPSEKAKAEVQAINRRIGWSFTDHNQADANALWHWGMRRHYPAWQSPLNSPLLAGAWRK